MQEIQTNNIILLDNEYSWKTMSLSNLIKEGNLPFLWLHFFQKKEILDILFNISDQIEAEKDTVIYPSPNLIFRAFSLPLEKIKVVILGMDPYHDGAANGLCFSVLPNRRINPSLNNIYSELELEYPENKIIKNGNLSHWSDQGCLLLNSALTVEKGNPESHVHIWYDFTEKLIRYISEKRSGIAWLLMGKKAQAFISDIKDNNHKLFLTSHPSPYSARAQGKDYPAFIGSNVFRNINTWLGKNKIIF